MVHFDHKLAHVDSSEDLVDNLDTLCVRDHGIVLPGNVEVALVKLPEVVEKISLKLGIKSYTKNNPKNIPS